MTKALTTEERVLLQRYYDGDELTDEGVAGVETLLNGSSAARVFMATLEELTTAMQGAEESMWEDAGAPSAENVVAAAADAAVMADAPLSDLAPLLERFSDGEVVAEEMAAVQALLEERQDVADYLANLKNIHDGVLATHDELVDRASFDGFWSSIESRIDAEETTFEPDEHRVLLYRYHDGEVTPAERARVDAWLDAGHAEVAATLSALGELNLASRAAIEVAAERADLDGLWLSIEDAIDDEIEAGGENVVSLEREKRERKGFLADYGQGVFAAVATVLIVAIGAGLFNEQLFGPAEKVIVEKTVVIVDSVEYQPGSSVMVNSPMKQASATTVESSESDGADADEEEPTVIWLLDTSDDGASTKSNDEDETGVDEESKDETDIREEISDQPI